MTSIGIDPSFTACGVSDGERHIIIATKPRDDQNAAVNLRRRSLEILKGIAAFIGDRDAHVFIEGPMATARGAMHLYELGWLMNDLHCGLPTLCSRKLLGIHEVPIATLRKWATGKGNAPKDAMKLAVFKKFDVEFDRDPGCDKLFAFLLARYGAAVVSGEITEVFTKRRGAGARAKQIARGNSAA